MEENIINLIVIFNLVIQKGGINFILLAQVLVVIQAYVQFRVIDLGHIWIIVGIFGIFNLFHQKLHG